MRLLLFGLLWLLGGAAGFADQRQPLPNIVLMMADDMGLGDTSAYQDFTGNSDAQQVETPAMQRLANRGIRFTDAHTPSSRCSPTRYGLLTGRYPWRNRLKYWVLFGSQGDPMIETDRPTLATLTKSAGYRTAMVGKWHVGVRYRQNEQQPAAEWQDADLQLPLFDGPSDHGFDECYFTSRSHGTSGPAIDSRRSNGPDQNVGPGHIHGRKIVAATAHGKQLQSSGPNAYVLRELGGRHLTNAIDFLQRQTPRAEDAGSPFFLYYACNSNHTPYTPDDQLLGTPVAKHSRSVAGELLDARADFIYENDVALSKLVEFLESNDDPRRPGHALIDNTIVVFTSDNGAEKDSDVATGPFRSNKGSAFEGGHRVPFLVSWPLGGVGDGDPKTPGPTNTSLVGLIDLYATIAEIIGKPLSSEPALAKGGEDSVSLLPAWRGETLSFRPMFFNDHKQASDPAAMAMRLDDPMINGQVWEGQWKIFFNARLIRRGVAEPTRLFNLAKDPTESSDLLLEESLRPLIQHLTAVAVNHRTAGGHNLAGYGSGGRLRLSWNDSLPDQGSLLRDVRELFHAAATPDIKVDVSDLAGRDLQVTISAVASDGRPAKGFRLNPRGLGIGGGSFDQVESGEAIVIRFNCDVLLESVSILAGNGNCGGWYQLGSRAPQQIYCIDADIDSRDQSGILSDLGVLKAGEQFRLDSNPFLGVEAAGQWRLGDITFRIVDRQSRLPNP